MKPKVKKILWLFIVFILGILIGGGGLALWSSSSLQFIAETIALNYSAFEGIEALDQYLYSTNIDNSIYALQHLIKFRELQYKPAHAKKIPKTYFFNQAISYIRLGNLYEKKGNVHDATESFNKGFEISVTHNLFEKWIGTDKEIRTVSDLRKFVNKLDDGERRNKKVDRLN